MKGMKTVVVAQKKLNPEMLKKRKADSNVKKQKAAKKNTGAPKRPPTAFFVFMQDFRKTYKENFPDNKSVALVAKAGGDKWKSMSESEKAPYVAKASKSKAEYEKAVEAHKNGSVEEVKAAESEKSSSYIQDHDEQEASSSNWIEHAHRLQGPKRVQANMDGKLARMKPAQNGSNHSIRICNRWMLPIYSFSN